jgi:hypothetical protein
MTTVRKRWWRMAALAVVGGGVATGGWYSYERATPAEGQGDAGAGWAQAAPAAPPAPPAVAEVDRTPEAKPITGGVVPAGGVQSSSLTGGTVTPVIPVVPISGPPIPAPSMPSIPAIPAVPAADQPISVPAAPPAVPVSTDKGLPAVPSMPAVPGADIPPLPVPPRALDLKTPTPPADKTPKPPTAADVPVPGAVSPALPGLPPLPGATAEPPKAPTAPGFPAIPPMPVAPVSPAPVVPMPTQPSGLIPAVPPEKSPGPAQPISPAKPDSGLKAPKTGNTLNPMVPALQPIAPPGGGTGREAPGKTVDRAKPPEPALGASDKFVFPVPAAPKPIDPPHRDDTMHKLTTAAAFAALSGALLTPEKAHAFPTVPAPAGVPVPGKVAKADSPDVEKLKKDLEAAAAKIADANKKIDELQKQVTRLTEQVNGRKDDKGLPLPSDPGAVEEVKRLKDKITKLEDEIKTLKTQTSLKPSVATPQAKTTGTVKIINEYPVEISIVVNDKSYRVAPNKVVDIEVPSGEFSYQLLTAGAPATRSVIQKGETVRLRIK